MRSESIIRYYVNVASDSLLWHTQYMSGQWGTAEIFVLNLCVGIALLLAVCNGVEIATVNVLQGLPIQRQKL